MFKDNLLVAVLLMQSPKQCDNGYQFTLVLRLFFCHLKSVSFNMNGSYKNHKLFQFNFSLLHKLLSLYLVNLELSR